jgi:hypothetical protein
MENRKIAEISIPMTRKEYMTLLDIFQIADWILHAFKAGERPDTEEYRKLEQKFCSYAKDMGLDNLVLFDEELKQYFTTSEYEATSRKMEFIKAFENDSFWDELIERLTERDLVQQEGGVDEVMKLSLEERIKKAGVLQEKYAKEFEKNGLKNLTVMPQFVSGWVVEEDDKRHS